MVITRKTGNADENLIINFLESKAFSNIIDKSVNKHICELLDKINKLETEVKILRESNIDLIRLLTNSERTDNFVKNDAQSLFNNSMETIKSNETVIEQNIESNINTLTRNCKAGDDNEYTLVRKNKKEHRRDELKNQNKNTHEKKIITGSSTEHNDKISFGGRERKIWLHVSRCEPEVQVEDIKNYLEDKCSGRQFIVEPLQKRGYPSYSFKIGAPSDLESMLYSACFWPRNIQIKEFEFFRPQPNKRGYSNRKFHGNTRFSSKRHF